MKLVYSLLVYGFAIVLIVSNISIFAVVQEIEIAININTLWEIAQIGNCCHLLPCGQQLELFQLKGKSHGFLDDMKNVSETCHVLKHYVKLDKNTNCKISIIQNGYSGRY